MVGGLVGTLVNGLRLVRLSWVKIRVNLGLDVMRDCCGYAGDWKYIITIDNWAGFAQSESLFDLLSKVNQSPRTFN